MNAICNPRAPFVTFIIVARNEEDNIRNLLDDYFQQDYPTHRRELIFVDGESEDATKRIAQEFGQVHPELAITILDNPKRIQAPGINLALREARGDIVCRVDGHISVPHNYISKGVMLLLEKEKNGVVCVGGPWHTVGYGFWGQAIAAVLSTPFGVGNAKFRYIKTAGYVDTVPCGFFWKWVFEEVGLYREDLVRSEDNELHDRIKKRGWKFYLSPELMTKYYCRSNITDFVHQAYGNGYWGLITWRQSSWRHLVPFAFVASLIILGFGSIVWETFHYIFWMMCLVYILSSLSVAFKIALKEKEWLWILALPFLFILLHVTYGIGSLWALFKSRISMRR